MNKFQKLINKKNKSKIVSLTAYSKNMASVIDNYCDIVLVGDSLGSVLYNYNSTRSVTLGMIIEHSKSVRLGVKRSLMVVDMPYNTYKNKNDDIGLSSSHNPVLDLLIDWHTDNNASSWPNTLAFKLDSINFNILKPPGSSISLDALCKRFRIDNSRREKLS